MKRKFGIIKNKIKDEFELGISLWIDSEDIVFVILLGKLEIGIGYFKVS